MPKCDCISPMYTDKADLMADASTDDNPAPDYSTTAVASMPCSIKTIGGDETYRGRQLEARISHVVETPWRSGIVADMRLSVVGGIYNGRTLNIESVRPRQLPGHPPQLELYCTELET